MKVKIYCIYENITDAPLYVGVTVHDLSKWLSGHISGSNSTKWAKEISEKGNGLYISLLEEVHVSEALISETFWIDRFFEMGIELKNSIYYRPYKNTIRSWWLDGKERLKYIGSHVDNDTYERIQQRALENEMNVDDYVANVITERSKNRRLVNKRSSFNPKSSNYKSKRIYVGSKFK